MTLSTMTVISSAYFKVGTRIIDAKTDTPVTDNKLTSDTSVTGIEIDKWHVSLIDKRTHQPLTLALTF